MLGSRGSNQISYKSLIAAAPSEFSAFTNEYLNKQEPAAAVKAHVTISYIA